MHNLLTEPLIRIQTESGTERTSLPGVIEALAARRVTCFPALRDHQQHPFHTFLAQLAAGVMHREKLGGRVPARSEEWAELLRTLTPDHPGDEPWSLVVPGLEQPGFMQPPAAPEMIRPTMRYETPDEMDILVNSKNHEFKVRAARNAQPDDWLFSLISLQTQAGNLGQGNYGISRMNMGTGNRSGLSLAPLARDPGSHFLRDVGALAERRAEILEAHGEYAAGGGLLILWTLPWDGSAASALGQGELDPMYIDLCRRVRLVSEEGKIRAYRASSKGTRIETKGRQGVTGDPWALVNLHGDDGEKVVTMPAIIGFRYDRSLAYLTGEKWRRPPMLSPTGEERENPAPMRVLGRALVRGQGKTQGYYRTDETAGPALQAALFDEDARQDLARIARERMDAVFTLSGGLGLAFKVYLGRGDAKRAGEPDQALAMVWRDRLRTVVDEGFISDLQLELEAAPDERPGVRDAWLENGANGLIDRARAVLREGMDSLRSAGFRDHIARNGATGALEHAVRRTRESQGGERAQGEEENPPR